MEELKESIKTIKQKPGAVVPDLGQIEPAAFAYAKKHLGIEDPEAILNLIAHRRDFETVLANYRARNEKGRGEVEHVLD